MMLGTVEDGASYLTGRSGCHLHDDKISVEQIQRVLFPPEFHYFPHQTLVSKPVEMQSAGLARLVASACVVGAIFGCAVFSQYSLPEKPDISQNYVARVLE